MSCVYLSVIEFVAGHFATWLTFWFWPVAPDMYIKSLIRRLNEYHSYLPLPHSHDTPDTWKTSKINHRTKRGSKIAILPSVHCDKRVKTWSNPYPHNPRYLDVYMYMYMYMFVLTRQHECRWIARNKYKQCYCCIKSIVVLGGSSRSSNGSIRLKCSTWSSLVFVHLEIPSIYSRDS
jgi:hypothetical protein